MFQISIVRKIFGALNEVIFWRIKTNQKLHELIGGEDNARLY